MTFFLFFPENRIQHFMQTVSTGDNLHQMSKLFNLEKIFQNVVCSNFYPKCYFFAWNKTQCIYPKYWDTELLTILALGFEYHIWPKYCKYPYERTVKEFCILQITASLLFDNFFIKANVLGTHLNCINLHEYPQHTSTKKIRKKNPTKSWLKDHLLSPSLIFFFLNCTQAC